MRLAFVSLLSLFAPHIRLGRGGQSCDAADWQVTRYIKSGLAGAAAAFR